MTPGFTELDPVNDPVYPRHFSTLDYHGASYRVSSPDNTRLFSILRRLRNRLERYISRHPEFGKALRPLHELPLPAPGSAHMMHRAALATGVGPMAAVAGSFAGLAAKELLHTLIDNPAGGDADGTGNGSGAGRPGSDGAGSTGRPGWHGSADPEIIIENGGDIFAILQAPLVIGLWIGPGSPFRELAFHILPGESPIAVCSSSSKLGHSYSEGKCDLVTVVSTEAALADACATAVCNRITSEETLQNAVEWGVNIDGIRGILAIKNDKMSMAGDLPSLLRHAEADISRKITRHRNSSFSSEKSETNQPD